MPPKSLRMPASKTQFKTIARYLHHHDEGSASITDISLATGLSYHVVRRIVRVTYPSAFIFNEYAEVMLSGEMPFAFEIEKPPVSVSEPAPSPQIPAADPLPKAKSVLPRPFRAEHFNKVIAEKWFRKYTNEATAQIIRVISNTKTQAQYPPDHEFWELYNSLRSMLIIMEIARAKDPAKKAAELLDKPETVPAIQSLLDRSEP